MFSCFLVSCLFFVDSYGKVGHVAKDAPEGRRVPPATLVKFKCENQWCDGQTSLSTEISLVVANNNRKRDIIGFGKEARNSGLKETARANVRHFSFGINRTRNSHDDGVIYCGRISKVSATCASENIIVVNYSWIGPPADLHVLDNIVLA